MKFNKTNLKTLAHMQMRADQVRERWRRLMKITGVLLCTPGCLTVPPVSAASVSPTALHTQYDPAIQQVAERNHVDPALLRAVVMVESGFKNHLVSSAGAVGLMQLMPSTGRKFGANDVRDPVQNLEAGARYIRYLQSMFKNDTRLVLAAYNAGEGNVIKHGYKVPAFAETRRYVARVLQFWHLFRRPGT